MATKEEEEAKLKLEAEEKAKAEEAARLEEEAEAKRKEEEEAKRKEEMVPVTRLTGLIKQDAENKKRIADLEKKIKDAERKNLPELDQAKADLAEERQKTAAAEAAILAKDAKIKIAAARTYFGTSMLSPSVVRLIPMDLVEVDDNDELTSSSKAKLDVWRKQPEIKPLFAAERRGGNSPRPGEAPAPLTLDEYMAIAHDPKKSDAERQAAHQRYLEGKK